MRSCVYGITSDCHLNMSLILLSKVWSSRLSILIAWKYSLGSKYPLAIRKVCLSTNSCLRAPLPLSWRRRSTWRRHRCPLPFCWPSGTRPPAQLLAFLPCCSWACSSSSCTAATGPPGCSCLSNLSLTLLEQCFKVLEVLIDGTASLHLTTIIQ